MKLWTTVGLNELPRLFGTGLDNPLSEEVIFYTEPELVAERALDMQEEENGLAFIEVDFPDEDLDDWFGLCMESHFLDLDQAQRSLNEDSEAGRLSESEYEERVVEIQGLDWGADSGQGSNLLAAFGYACLYVDVIVPPDMIKLLDPATMMEAVYTGDVVTIEEAMDTVEVHSFESLGPGFWVWLIFFMSQWFGPNWGTIVEEQEAAKKAEVRKKRRKKRAKRSRKKRQRRTPAE